MIAKNRKARACAMLSVCMAHRLDLGMGTSFWHKVVCSVPSYSIFLSMELLPRSAECAKVYLLVQMGPA